MPSPFPGMDPYLEHPDLWPEAHHRLITAIADAVAPLVRPKYRVAIEKRTYLLDVEDVVWVGIPDVTVGTGKAPREQLPGHMPTSARHEPITVTLPMPEEVRESFLEIREVTTREVITVIEVLSPGNKRAGEGRRVYEMNRRHVLSSLSHLVEVDLLRAGEAMPVTGEILGDYRILVSRSDQRPQAQLYAFRLSDPIPVFPLPLLAGDVQPEVDIQTLLGEVYDRAGFDLAVDYQLDPPGAVSQTDLNWVDALLHEKGLRGT